jgi:hypothetical protein
VTAGLADRVSEAKPAAAQAAWDLSVYDKAPAAETVQVSTEGTQVTFAPVAAPEAPEPAPVQAAPKVMPAHNLVEPSPEPAPVQAAPDPQFEHEHRNRRHAVRLLSTAA